MINCLKKNGLIILWLVAALGTVSTLYLSEVLDWPVCPFCWYQRICLYPQAIILGMAAFSEDFTIIRYILPLSILGFLLALFQYGEQKIPFMQQIHTCSAAGPSCSAIHLNLFGFITIPLLSAGVFLLLSLYQYCIKK